MSCSRHPRICSGPDFEDIMQAACAASNGCQVILTHNPRDFKIRKGLCDTLSLPMIMTPEEYNWKKRWKTQQTRLLLCYLDAGFLYFCCFAYASLFVSDALKRRYLLLLMILSLVRRCLKGKRFWFVNLSVNQTNMHNESYVFAQLTSHLNRSKFNRIVAKYQGDSYIKHFSCWNQLKVLMFGQLHSKSAKFG